MESVNGYIGVIAIVGFIAVIALAVFLIVGQRRLLKNIVAKKFAVNAFEEVNVADGSRTYAVLVSNRSLNDVVVSAFGVISGVKYFDFTERFKAANGENGSVAVTPRTPVKLNLTTKELERLIFSALRGGRFKSVKTYVIDSAGNQYEQRAFCLEKAMKSAYKKYLVRYNAAKKAQAKYEKTQAAFDFNASVRERRENGEPISFKDRLKSFFLRSVGVPSRLKTAKNEWMRAAYVASFYTEEDAAEALKRDVPADFEPQTEVAEEQATEAERADGAAKAEEQTAAEDAADGEERAEAQPPVDAVAEGVCAAEAPQEPAEGQAEDETPDGAETSAEEEAAPSEETEEEKEEEKVF